jgi:outer membrane protein OmpA-like peptidoglycan-associated protein
MASDVLDVSEELESIIGGDTARSAHRTHETAVEPAARASWRWSFVGIVAVGVSALALYVLVQSLSHRSAAREDPISFPASLYFDTPHAPLETDNLAAIDAIAKAVRSSSTPVVIAAYADPSGNRSENLRLAQKHAARVRNALVTAGVPRLRVTLVSPAFADTKDIRRVEISLIHGVRAFPAEHAGSASRK